MQIHCRVTVILKRKNITQVDDWAKKEKKSIKGMPYIMQNGKLGQGIYVGRDSNLMCMQAQHLAKSY